MPTRQRFNFQQGFIDPVDVIELAEAAKTRADWGARKRSAVAWSRAFVSTGIEQTKEKELQGTFLHRMFVEVLGYNDQGSGDSRWTLKNEPTTDINWRCCRFR